MRVAFLTGSLRTGGAERMHALLARTLLERGHDPLFWTIDAAGDTPRNLEILSGVPRTSILQRRLPGPARLVQLLQAWRPLRRMINEARPDVLYASLDWANWLALRATRGTKVPVVIGIPGGKGAIEWKRRIPDRLLAGESIAAMSAYSQDGVDSMRSKGIRAAVERIIAPGVDCERFKECHEQALHIRRALTVSTSTPLIGHIGRLHPVKDHPLLLRGFALLSGRPHLLCVGAGEPRYARRLRQLAAELGVADRVHWWAHRDDMPAVHSAIDVLAIPSISEGGPLVVAESMSCGTPCVSSRVGAAPEFIGDLGVVLRQRSARSLASAMQSLLESPPLPSACRQRILDQFTLGCMSTASMELFEQIV